MIMLHYHLWTQDGRTDNQYWIEAESEDEARSLVALNADGEATNPLVWQCSLSKEFQPPGGVILTGGGQTIPVEKRQKPPL